MSESDISNEEAKKTKEENAMADVEPETKTKKRSTKKVAESKKETEQSEDTNPREALTKKLQDMGVMAGENKQQVPESSSKNLSRFAIIGSLLAAVMIGWIAYKEITKNSGGDSDQVAQGAMQYPGPYTVPWGQPYAQQPLPTEADKQTQDEIIADEPAAAADEQAQAAADPWGRPYAQRPTRPSWAYPPQERDSDDRYSSDARPMRRWGPQPYPMWTPPHWRLPPYAQQTTPAPETGSTAQSNEGDDAAKSTQPESREWPPFYPPQYRPYPPPGYYYGPYGYYPPATAYNN